MKLCGLVVWFYPMYREPQRVMLIIFVDRYDRETSVFTPPKNSSMSIWVTSLLTTSEILNMILEKYQITSDQENYGLFLVKDSGGKYKIFLKKVISR